MHPPSTPERRAATRSGRAAVAIERGAIIVILAAMAILPALQALGRTIAWLLPLEPHHWITSALATGVPGSAQYVQHLTLWIGFLGALIAAGAGKHLSLATGELILKGWARRAALWVSSTLAAWVTAVLAYASFEFVRVDTARTSVLAGGIPEWWSETIMPVALAAMSVRFAWRASSGWPGRTVAFAAAAGGLALAHLGPALAPHAEQIFWPAIAAIALGAIVGAPVFVAFAGAAMLLFFLEGTPVASVPAETYRLVTNPTLPAIPLLTAAGYVLAEGGASERLLRLFRALVGWLPGGMALTICIVCAGFTTFTGGSGVTILALGGLMLPMLRAERYSEGFSLGLVTASGSLGLLFPPSIPVILYAVYANASHEDLFIAGFLPGLLLVLVVAAYAIGVGLREGAPRTPFSLREALAALWDAKIEIAIPAIVVASIFAGLATMVEAAAIALLLAVLSQSVIFRDIHPVRELPVVLEHATTLVGAVLILLGVAMGLTSWLVDAEVPGQVLAWTKSRIESPILFLLALNGVLLVIGSVLEIYSAIVILAPLLAPMAVAYGIDPLHLGIIFLANLELGFLFPPVGLNLLLSSMRFERPLKLLYRVTLPFLAIRAAGVLLVTYVPAMTTGFLKLVRG